MKLTAEFWIGVVVGAILWGILDIISMVIILNQ